MNILCGNVLLNTQTTSFIFITFSYEVPKDYYISITPLKNVTSYQNVENVEQRNLGTRPNSVRRKAYSRLHFLVRQQVLEWFLMCYLTVIKLTTKLLNCTLLDY